MDELVHWDCFGMHGELEHINKPVLDSTPEAAMDELVLKASLRLRGEAVARVEVGSPPVGAPRPRVIRFRSDGAAWQRL